MKVYISMLIRIVRKPLQIPYIIEGVVAAVVGVIAVNCCQLVISLVA